MPNNALTLQDLKIKDLTVQDPLITFMKISLLYLLICAILGRAHVEN